MAGLGGGDEREQPHQVRVARGPAGIRTRTGGLLLRPDEPGPHIDAGRWCGGRRSGSGRGCARRGFGRAEGRRVLAVPAGVSPVITRQVPESIGVSVATAANRWNEAQLHQHAETARQNALAQGGNRVVVATLL